MFAIVAAVALLQIAYDRSTTGRSAPVDLADARALFPGAAALGGSGPLAGSVRVMDDAGDVCGIVLRTAPHTDDLVGYSGPNDLLVGLDESLRVVSVQILSSGDTVAHVDDVTAELAFWGGLEGWSAQEERAPSVDAVSGSTLTSLAMKEAVVRRLSGAHRSLRFPDPLSPSDARVFFPGADRLSRNEEDPEGWKRVADDRGEWLGFLARTSPHADNVLGYRGPTEAVIGIDRDGDRLIGVRLRTSYDTDRYVSTARDGLRFLDRLSEYSVSEWADLDLGMAGIEGVSGATQTSYALAEGLRRSLRAVKLEGKRSWPGALRDLALLFVIVIAVWLRFGPLRQNRVAHNLWRIVRVVAIGLLLGDLLSLSLLVGQARHGLASAAADWSGAWGLSILAITALFVPWATGRQIYCRDLCPHGALQEWASSVRRFRIVVPSRARRFLRWIPGATLLAAVALAFAVPRFDLGSLEPFDAWVLGVGALATTGIAVLGVLACFATPMAYCRFGCPTGALLEFVRSRGANDGFGRRELIAGAALLLGGAALWAGADAADTGLGVEPEVKPPLLRGTGFGTTWSVRLREPALGSAGSGDLELWRESLPELQRQLSTEIERIESELSSWRPDSELSLWNDSDITLPMDASDELRALFQFGLSLSQSTSGVFDFTVGPLVEAWGAGPSGRVEGPPDRGQIEELLQSTGWDGVIVDDSMGTIRKTHPQLRVDLGALLHGYAADRFAGVLQGFGVAEYLIEVGGELRAAGAWRVAIEDPKDPSHPSHPSHPSDPVRTLVLKDAALATSGTYREPNHLIDPRSGEPVVTRWSLCAVIANDALTADGWATAYLASAGDAPDLSPEEGVHVLLIGADGAEFATDDRAFRDP